MRGEDGDVYAINRHFPFRAVAGGEGRAGEDDGLAEAASVFSSGAFRSLAWLFTNVPTVLLAVIVHLRKRSRVVVVRSANEQGRFTLNVLFACFIGRPVVLNEDGKQRPMVEPEATSILLSIALLHFYSATIDRCGFAATTASGAAQ